MSQTRTRAKTRTITRKKKQINQEQNKKSKSMQKKTMLPCGVSVTKNIIAHNSKQSSRTRP